MPTLTERIDQQITDLRAELKRIEDQAVLDVDAVNRKLAVLREAKSVLSPDVERAYATLRAMGLVKEI